MVLRCTAKALDLLGVRKMSLVELPPSDDDWYLNLLWFDRRKCLLLTHAGTVFSIFIPDVRKAELAPIGPYVIDAVVGALRAEGLPVDALGELDLHDALLAKSASRQVLGFMNDVASHISSAVHGQSNVREVDAVALNAQLQRTLHDHEGRYATPLDLVAEQASHAAVAGNHTSGDRATRAQLEPTANRGPSGPGVLVRLAERADVGQVLISPGE